MSDDDDLRGPRDATRIAIGEDREVRYWTDKFGVTVEQLNQAVNAVGSNAAAVERHLRR